MSSIAAKASPSASRSCPPRLRTAACSVASSSSATSAAQLRPSSPGSRSRSWSGVQRSSRWYSGFGHLVDPAPQRRAAGPGEQLLEQAPVLDGEHLPAGGVEHALQPGGADVGHHPVERLPVEVDDPDDLAELAHHRVEHRLPARALVQLGVADQRVLAAACPTSARSRGDVPAGQRTPDRRGGADADRAGRVVDRVGVLGAATGSSAARRTPAASSGSARPARRAGS